MYYMNIYSDVSKPAESAGFHYSHYTFHFAFQIFIHSVFIHLKYNTHRG